MTDTILFVDDDVLVVSALQRSLNRAYHIEIAGSAQDALQAIADSSYAVVVSDLRMPGMSGIDFLSKTKELAPDTVRILLTGHADLEAAIDSVNEGNLFRFLTKPCPKDTLTRALDAALKQHHLQTAEREVLQETLNGTVAVLIEILGAIQPIAFGRALRVRRLTRDLALELKLASLWELESAALLSQIGCVAVQPELLQRYYAGDKLTEDEILQVRAQSRIGRQLLYQVPRLHAVSEIIERQYEPFDATEDLSPEAFTITAGAQVLRVAQDFDRWLGTGLAADGALVEMHRRESEYDPKVLVALERLKDVPQPDSASPNDFGMGHPELTGFRQIADQVLRALKDERLKVG